MDDNQPAEKPLMLLQKRLTIPLSDEDFDYLHRMAGRHQVSVAHLGQIALTLMMLSDVRGEFSMVPEFMLGDDLPRA